MTVTCRVNGMRAWVRWGSDVVIKVCSNPTGYNKTGRHLEGAARCTAGLWGKSAYDFLAGAAVGAVAGAAAGAAPGAAVAGAAAVGVASGGV